MSYTDRTRSRRLSACDCPKIKNEIAAKKVAIDCLCDVDGKKISPRELKRATSWHGFTILSDIKK